MVVALPAVLERARQTEAYCRFALEVELDALTWAQHPEGTALLDDGTQVSLGADVLVGSPFRMLRPGQRVQLHLEDSTAVRLGLPGTL